MLFDRLNFLFSFYTRAVECFHPIQRQGPVIMLGKRSKMCSLKSSACGSFWKYVRREGQFWDFLEITLLPPLCCGSPPPLVYQDNRQADGFVCWLLINTVTVLQRWAYLKLFSMANQSTKKRGQRVHQVSRHALDRRRLCNWINFPSEFNLQWGEGTPSRWYERSEKVPNGLRALIAVNQKCSPLPKSQSTLFNLLQFQSNWNGKKAYWTRSLPYNLWKDLLVYLAAYYVIFIVH